MFNQLSERLAKTVKNLRGQGRLTEDNIKDSTREIRMALIEADVALPVIKEFIEDVKQKALGEEVATSLNPGQAFIKIVNDELTQIMGEANSSLNLKTQPPAVILMAGLQGAGKTTSVAKLARFLKEKEKKSVMVASADIYRPAAIKQLETLAHAVDVVFFPSDSSQQPEEIAQAAIDAARKQHIDVLILDTAGRLAINQDMMDEIKRLHAAVKPIETLFVVDSMTGQDAANTAKAFNEALPLTGVILSKADGDARGGAALSVRKITGKPIKFIGVGEKVEALEAFHPERIASQILGMGDVLSLIEEVEQKIDKKNADKMAQKLKKGKKFTLQDYAEQLQQMDKMGGMSKMLSKMPGLPNLPDGALEQMKNNRVTVQTLAIIRSMTPQERKFPEVIKASRKRRIATGSGTQVQDVNRMLKQFLQMQKMLKKFGKNPAKLQQMMQSAGKGGMPF
jgi:signal recognition particle subunit SRP54